jgi:N6-adenosine-specific RNA methylase IME4
VTIQLLIAARHAATCNTIYHNADGARSLKHFRKKRMSCGKKYNIIYADPAWSYYNDMTVTLDQNKAKDFISRNPYKVMSTADIKALPIKDISAETCILFIWATDYHLSRCCEVIKEWGFKYKTVGFVWQKLNKKNEPVCFIGSYTMKSGIELCLLATKGRNPSKLINQRNIRALVQSRREEHSKKPDEVRNRIVRLCGDLPRIELFAREKHEGWDVWGDEIESDIDLMSLPGS